MIQLRSSPGHHRACAASPRLRGLHFLEIVRKGGRDRVLRLPAKVALGGGYVEWHDLRFWRLARFDLVGYARAQRLDGREHLLERRYDAVADVENALHRHRH